MSHFLDFIFHLDKNLPPLVQQWGGLTYGILFGVIFLETGFVFTPFLPGDSLIFVAATLASRHVLNIFLLWLLFSAASILGDSVNYWVGTRFGKALERSQSIRRDYLDRTEEFYKKYGKKTIIMARFVPIVRTFAPFVAGMGKMSYAEFLAYNAAGGVAWVSFFSFVGYFFGRITWVQQHLETVILGIVVLSFVPPVWEWWRQRKNGRSGGT